MGKYILTALLVLGLAGAAYAAPVGLTSEADLKEAELWADNNIGVTASFIVDTLQERSLNIDSGEYEMISYFARIGVSFMDRINVYLDLGTANDMEYCYTIKGENHKSYFDDAFMYGIGANALLYRWDNGLEVGVGASYRQADMDLEKIVIDGTEYKQSQLSSVKNGEYQEYQGAIELAWKMDYITPYIGIKFSEVEVDSRATVLGAVRDASGKNASENVGGFAGITITPLIDPVDSKMNRLSLNIEGRFVDEQAVNVGLTYSF